MKTFNVYIPEVWHKVLVVEAEDEKAAIEKASLSKEAYCKSNFNPYENSWFVETMTKELWDAEDITGKEPG